MTHIEHFATSDLKLGIISGGQLGKLLTLAASNWDISTAVMDKDPRCPAASCCHSFTQGDPASYDDVYAFGSQVDLLTFEVEDINVEALRQLKADGVAVSPDPESLAIIQDKGLQKQFAQQHGIPTAPFSLYADRDALIAAVDTGERVFPFVQKLRRGGYDGRGVAIIQGAKDLDQLLDGPSMVEDLVDLAVEISVIAARNERGEVRCFPVVDMEFDERVNMVEQLLCPSSCTDEVCKEAVSIAQAMVDAFDFTGLLAVEMFVDKSGAVWMNEVAPRPHNSGHHTIDSVVTSQYEQHLRAIFNLALGSTHLKLPAIMINLLGEPDMSGPVRYQGLEDALAIDGVKVHLYGKKETRPFRKMGHVTVLAPTVEEVRARADKVKNTIKVISWQ